MALLSEGRRKVQRGGGLRDAALLVGERDHLGLAGHVVLRSGSGNPIGWGYSHFRRRCPPADRERHEGPRGRRLRRGARLVCARLVADGHEVIEAGDGQAAVDVAVRERPDVIVLDRQMPKMDGFEVCTRLRAEHDAAVGRDPHADGQPGRAHADREPGAGGRRVHVEALQPARALHPSPVARARDSRSPSRADGTGAGREPARDRPCSPSARSSCSTSPSPCSCGCGSATARCARAPCAPAGSMREGVAMFAVEVADELPRGDDPLRAPAAARDAARDRARALRQRLRPARRRSSPSAASSPRRSARCARASCCSACAPRRSSASSAGSATPCPRCARACATASRSCASRARTRSRASAPRACSRRC